MERVTSTSENQDGSDLYGDYGDLLDYGDYGVYGDYGDYGLERRLETNDTIEQFDPNNYDRSLTLEDRIDVSIVSRKPLDEETEKELQQYSWKIESLSQSTIDISLDFLFPHSVSVDRDNPTSVWIKAKFSDFEPGWIDDLVIAAIELPK